MKVYLDSNYLALINPHDLTDLNLTMFLIFRLCPSQYNY